MLQPCGSRHEEYCVVWAINRRAKLSCDFSLPPLKVHSQDATRRQSKGGDAGWQVTVSDMHLVNYKTDQLGNTLKDP